jgi:hypothetical protein
MDTHFHDPSSGDPPDREHRLQQVIDFWNGLSCREDAGETTWGVLEDLQAEVSDCLSREPVDLNLAESLTAYAALLISGELLF